MILFLNPNPEQGLLIVLKMSTMQDLHRILDQFTPRPEPSGPVGGLNFAMVHNEQDRQYLHKMAQMLKSFDPGNPNLNIGFNLLDGQYHLWLLNFSGKYNVHHFRLLAGVQHPVANWKPFREENVDIGGVEEFGTGIRVRIDPLPSNTLTLPITQAPPEIKSQQQLLMHNPSPTHAIVPVQQSGPIIVHEVNRRDASPKRAENKKQNSKKPKKPSVKRGRQRRQPVGFLAGLAQTIVGAPDSDGDSRSASSSSSSSS